MRIYDLKEINGEITLAISRLRPMNELKPFQRALIYSKSEKEFTLRLPGALLDTNDDQAGWVPVPVFIGSL